MQLGWQGSIRLGKITSDAAEYPQGDVSRARAGGGGSPGQSDMPVGQGA